MCEWCGRPFLLRDQRRHGRVLWTIGAILCVLGVAAVVAIAFVNAARPTARGTSAAPTPTMLADQPTPLPTPEPTAVEEPTPQPAEYVRVVNTGGAGVILRREPNTTAPRVAARAENTILRVVGPEESVDGRLWRQVEDAQGNRGWTPAEFLAPAPPPGR